MYYYILDPTNIEVEKFERAQIELQGLLAEFNIAGETARVTPLRTIANLVDTASSRGVKTLVACGTDDTFNLMLAALHGRDFVLAFVPFDPTSSYLSKILGLGSIQHAVKTIAGRRIEKIDLANIGSNYFISYLELGTPISNIKKAGFFSSLGKLSGPDNHLKMRVDNSYEIEVHTPIALILNTRSSSSKDASVANPTDGYLDLLILPKMGYKSTLQYKTAIGEGFLETIPGSSVIRTKHIELLEPKGFPVRMSGRVLTKFPCTVEICQERLRLIVGKNRTF